MKNFRILVLHKFRNYTKEGFEIQFSFLIMLLFLNFVLKAVQPLRNVLNLHQKFDNVVVLWEMF